MRTRFSSACRFPSLDSPTHGALDLKTRKAVITAAGADQRHLPLQTLVDRDGSPKSALRVLLDEATRAGMQEIAIVVHPHDRDRYASAAGDPGPRLTFITQSEPRGYAHALLQARSFVADEPFLHFVGDHLWVSHAENGAARQLVTAAEGHDGAAISAVQATRESQLRLYGAIGGTRVQGVTGLYAVDAVLEKPTPTAAEQHLFVPGLRVGHYLCFFGMHVLSAAIFTHLETEVRAAQDPRPSLTGALTRLLREARWYAFEVSARRFNLGETYGLLTAQLALALAGKDKDEVLTLLTDLLAQRERTR